MDFIIAKSGDITFEFIACLYEIKRNGKLIEWFTIDDSRGWETQRLAYSQAAQVFNKLVPENDAIPCF